MCDGRCEDTSRLTSIRQRSADISIDDVCLECRDQRNVSATQMREGCVDERPDFVGKRIDRVTKSLQKRSERYMSYRSVRKRVYFPGARKSTCFFTA